ncbi:MAG: Crp/Fnr family transcriptional regulator [Gammaproteobacteria bacterium]|nr:Crp/Fnr family transcriptional regulator [Gammaproteobacteria bacterium]
MLAGRADRYWNFHQSGLLTGLADTQVESLHGGLTPITLESGDTLFSLDEVAHYCYLVDRGALKLFRLAVNGNEKVVDIATAGTPVGLDAMFLADPRYTYFAESVEKTTLIPVKRSVFLSLAQDSPTFCFNLLTALSGQIKGHIEEIDSLCLKSATNRFAGYLLERLSGPTQTLKLPVCKGVLASRLSITPETLSRILSKLRKQGVIEIRGSNISIQNIEQLRRLV